MCSQKVRWCRLPSGAVPAANLQHRQPNREHILQHPGETNISHSNEGISKQHETTKQSGRVSKRPGNAQRASSKDPSSLNHGENLCASVEVLNPERRDFKCPIRYANRRSRNDSSKDSPSNSVAANKPRHKSTHTSTNHQTQKPRGCDATVSSGMSIT